MIDFIKTAHLAIWALTPGGAALGRKIAGMLPDADLYLSRKCGDRETGCLFFSHLADAVTKKFSGYDGHLFIMSTGIVIRVLAPLILHKTIDPAVVVMDETGRYIISLLAGHIGGANRLTKEMAALIRAEPVITTATDVNRMPSIDILAGQRDLAIENPGAIRHVSMSFLKGDRIYLHDPYRLMIDALPRKSMVADRQTAFQKGLAGIFIDDRVLDLPDQILVLRPKSLVVGIGCNRHTPMTEMRHLLLNTFKESNLSPASVACFASVDIKADEKGLLALGRSFKCPVLFFSKKELGEVTTIEHPSAVVEKHLGVKSVCEAAAILAAQNSHLTVPKQKTPNVTVSIARKSFISSA